ncbi:MAG: phosphodiester glycosidase family protein [Anaerolineae bacterium]
MELAPGIKQRYLFAPIPDTTEFSTIYALRLNPDLIDFEVYFDREQPRSMEEWQAFTGSPIVFNGGFFSSDNMPVGRLVVDGALFGFPLSRVYGPESVSIPGIFAVVDDEVAIYAAGRSTYSPRGMRFDQAIESYPMLLLPGQIPAFPEDTGVRTRRTVIGIDQQGLVIVLLIDQPIFSLYELALWLSTSDLALDTALNLDGGRSSGLAVSLPGERTIIPAYVPLPIVMLAYPDREE